MAVTRATLIDIAKQSGVSTATVDRVLNKRPGVRERTRDIVFQTASRLGYIALPGEISISRAPVALDFILPNGANSFIRNLAKSLEEISADRGDIELRLHFIEGFDPYALADALLKLSGHSKAVAVIALDHPVVREALRQLRNSGTIVFTMISDISNVPREGYVGIDNRAAGRLAAICWAAAAQSARPSWPCSPVRYPIAVTRNAKWAFAISCANPMPILSVVELREVHDDDEAAYREAAPCSSNPDLAASIISAPVIAASPALWKNRAATKKSSLRPRTDRSYAQVPARRHHGCRHRPERPCRGPRNHRQLARTVRGEAVKSYIPIRVQPFSKRIFRNEKSLRRRYPCGRH